MNSLIRKHLRRQNIDSERSQPKPIPINKAEGKDSIAPIEKNLYNKQTRKRKDKKYIYFDYNEIVKPVKF